MPSLIDSVGSFSFPYHVSEVFEEALNPTHVLATDLQLITLHYDDQQIHQGGQFRARVKDVNLPFSVRVSKLVPNEYIGLHGSKFGLADVQVGIGFTEKDDSLTDVNYQVCVDLGRIGLTIAKKLHAHEKAQEDSHILVSGILGSVHRAIAHRRVA